MKLIILMVFLSILGMQNANAQCQASFTYVDNGNGNYTFTSTSTGNIINEAWYLDGVSYSGNIVNHTFFNNGSLIAELYIYTLGSTCQDNVAQTIPVTSSQPCNFAVITYDTTGNEVHFFGNHTPSDSILWEFGDGTTSNAIYLNGGNGHTYPAPGTYYYCVTVDACPPFCDSVTVIGDSCNATVNFTYVDNGNGNYNFTSSITGGTAPYTYLWNWNDGTPSSTLQNPSHSYPQGVGIPYLTVVDANNCSTNFQDTVLGSTTPCNITASFTYVDNGNGNYDFTSSVIGGTAPYSYSWTFDDIGPNGFSSDEHPSYTFINGAIGGVTFDLIDANGCMAYYLDTVNTTFTPCNYTVTTIDTTGSEVDFIINIGAGITCFIDFGDNTSTTLTGFSSGWAGDRHQYPSAGTYYYCVTVGNCPPICDSVTVIGDSCNATVNFTYVDNGNGDFYFTNTSLGNYNSYYWNFGDGTTSTFGHNIGHTYTSNGTFVVELAMYDSNNTSCIDYYIETIQVSGVQNPLLCNSAFVIYPDSSGNGDVIVFNTSSGNSLTYLWDFGDGNTSNQQYPSYTYTTAGPFYLCLTVDNGNGCVSTYCDSVSTQGIVFKQGGFTLNIQGPVITNIEATKLISELNIYPNPFKNNVTLELGLLEQTMVKVFVTDMLGNNIAKISNEILNTGNNKLNWNAKDVANGIYLLNIETNNSLQVKKLILNR